MGYWKFNKLLPPTCGFSYVILKLFYFNPLFLLASEGIVGIDLGLSLKNSLDNCFNFSVFMSKIKLSNLVPTL